LRGKKGEAWRAMRVPAASWGRFRGRRLLGEEEEEEEERRERKKRSGPNYDSKWNFASCVVWTLWIILEKTGWVWTPHVGTVQLFFFVFGKMARPSFTVWAIKVRPM
jgi:hypothetical protein